MQFPPFLDIVLNCQLDPCSILRGNSVIRLDFKDQLRQFRLLDLINGLYLWADFKLQLFEGVLTDAVLIERGGMSHFPPSARTALTSLVKLKALILSNCDLQDVSGIPFLPTVTILDISCNLLNDRSIGAVVKFKPLQRLNFSHNYVNELKSIKFIKKLPNLTRLECLDNPFSITHCGYQKLVWKAAPHLIALNQTNREGEWIEDDFKDIAPFVLPQVPQSQVKGDETNKSILSYNLRSQWSLPSQKRSRKQLSKIMSSGKSSFVASQTAE